MCKIAILENYTHFCSGIRPVLDQIEEFEVVAESKQLKEMLPLVKMSKPDVVIVDALHCEDNGTTAIRKIRAKASKTPILLVVNSDYSAHFESYIAMGVNGLVFTSFGKEQLVEAVRTLKNGSDYFPPQAWILLKEYLRSKRKDILPQAESKPILSNRELDVLRLFCKGYTYKEIAHKLNISSRTVETHKKNISTKINVRSTAEMVEFAVQNNLT